MHDIIHDIVHVFKHAVMITGFVFAMMLVIEYINVQSKGLWKRFLIGKPWRQYVFAGILGAIPGCLGAFTVTTLFSHRLLSFGAIVATMIATSGDEAFVMFAMMPDKALWITLSLLGLGIIAGYVTDKLKLEKRLIPNFPENDLPLHQEEHCDCTPKKETIQHLLKPSVHRLVMMVIILFLLIAVATGFLSHDSKNWVKYTILLTTAFSLFVVLTVPEHFLKDHLWGHILKIHMLRIFLWTLGTLLVIHLLMDFINVESWVSNNYWLVLLIAVLVGLIPESGPHLVFITLYFSGVIPISILLVNSIVQDGHGMLPLLAESKQAFIAVKIVNVAVALLIGAGAYFLI